MSLKGIQTVYFICSVPLLELKETGQPLFRRYFCQSVMFMRNKQIIIETSSNFCMQCYQFSSTLTSEVADLTVLSVIFYAVQSKFHYLQKCD